MNDIDRATQSVMDAHENAKNDPSRPQFHLLPPSMWMNDPNGLIYYNNKYHLFYQHNPFRAKWGPMYWGHAESSDLIHWTHLQIALAPDKKKGEKYCFSGCCVDDDGIPTILYTSIHSLLNVLYGGQTWIATSDSDLIEWRRNPNNPIMKNSMHNITIRHWRDPYVWKENNVWYMVMGGQLTQPKRGAVFLYTSTDLYHWVYKGIFSEGDPNIHKKPWECPNLLKWDNNAVLIISPMDKVQFSLVNLKQEYTNSSEWFIFDHGREFYAPQAIKHPHNEEKYLLWGWIKGGGIQDQWNGCFSIPRELELIDNRLKITPSSSITQLRHHHRHFINQSAICNLHDGCGELILKIPQDVSFTIDIYQNPKNKFSIIYHPKSNSFIMGKEITEYHSLQEEITLHIFIDRSVIEAFFNYQECFTTRFYPLSYTDISIDCKVPGTELLSLDVWDLSGIINNYASK
ncbi:MAG: glycoside hydrolase family 32 protein [Candidatus Lokiarchaeota archaeon]|nr:glycoside hydrolase family 32 protein [Candidatus Lokiarchaeota archaeon]